MIPYIHVLLSGGSGQRLWPLSRYNFPKPYISFPNETQTMFQQTILRHRSCQRHIIVTGHHLYYQSHYQVGAYARSPVSYLLESEGKNTAPAILMACFDANEDDVMVVTPSDHWIRDSDAYQKTVQHAITLSRDASSVGLIGIVPRYPSTEYGYINANGHRVVAFKEKPNAAMAKGYMSDGNHYWNSGIFCFQAGVVSRWFKSQWPDQYATIRAAYDARAQDGYVAMGAIMSQSFDRAVMERMTNQCMVLGEFGWDDRGCFDDMLPHISNHDDGLDVNAKNVWSFSETNKPVAFHDVSDVYVIESNDAILVGKKGHSKHVSQIVERVGVKCPDLMVHSNVVYRPWGFYMVLHEMDGYKVKKIVVYPQSRLSLQTHRHRSEHWTCVCGIATILNDGQTQSLHPNQSVYIEKGVRHRIENNTHAPVVIIEIQCGDYLDEDDIVRIESDYS